MRHFLLSLAVAGVLAVPVMAAGSAQTLAALPAALEYRNPPVQWKVTGPDRFTITAPAHSNWFISPFDLGRVDSAPTLLFHAPEDFILSAKISLTPLSRWDSGALALYVDKDHWAKLCLETPQGDGHLSVVMVVTNGASDDSYSIPAAGHALYLKIARQGPGVTFFASEDGKIWQMVRAFRLSPSQDLQAGFLAQSPTGNGIAVDFSELRYSTAPVKNLFTGQ